MNLYFRMIRIILKAWLDPLHDKPLEPTELTLRVWPFDLDPNLHMNNARYLSWMDLGRVYHMGVTGLYRESLKRKWMPVVGHIDIKYIRSLPPFANVTLKTEIGDHDEKYIKIKHTFIHKGHPAAIAHVKGVFIHKTKGKVKPEEVKQALNI